MGALFRKREVYVVVRWSDKSLFNIEGVYKHMDEAVAYVNASRDGRLRCVPSNLCRYAVYDHASRT